MSYELVFLWFVRARCIEPRAERAKIVAQSSKL